MQRERGKIFNRDRSKQSYDFTGLQFGTITPSDMDCFIEYQNKAWVFVELKSNGVDVPFGQLLALERLTDDLERAGKPTLMLFAYHTTPNVDDDIDVAQALVYAQRVQGEWIEYPTAQKTVRFWVQQFLEHVETVK